MKMEESYTPVLEEPVRDQCKQVNISMDVYLID